MIKYKYVNVQIPFWIEYIEHLFDSYRNGMYTDGTNNHYFVVNGKEYIINDLKIQHINRKIKGRISINFPEYTRSEIARDIYIFEFKNILGIKMNINEWIKYNG